MSMIRRDNIGDLNDYDLLNWIFDQELPVREGLYQLADARSLQGLVDFVRDNFNQIKQIENEKARINREA